MTLRRTWLAWLSGAIALAVACGSDPTATNDGACPTPCPDGAQCVAGQCVASAGPDAGDDAASDGGPQLETDGGARDAARDAAPLCPGADRCAKDGLTRACWDGPDGARSVGACKDGVQTCSGGHWGPCVGEVLPALQDACNPDDDANCNGAPGDGCACTGGTTRPCFSGPASLIGTGVCVAGVQHCVTTGEFSTWSTDCVGEVPPPCDYQTRPLDPVPNPHVETTAAVLNDRLFVISGAPGSMSNNCACISGATGVVDVLDPTGPDGGQWSQAAPVNLPRAVYPIAVTVGCNIFLFAGADPSSGALVRTTERYDPGPDQWVKLPPSADLPSYFTGYDYGNGVRGMAIAAAAVGTEVLAVSRTDGKTAIFDTATSAWRQTTAAGQPLAQFPGSPVCPWNLAAPSTYRNAHKVVVSGCDAPTSQSGGGFYEYDFDTNAWTFKAPTPDGASLAEHAVVSYGPRVVTLGGDYASTGDRIIVYNSDTGTAAMSPTHLTAGRSDHVAGYINGKIYLAGGIVPGTANALVPAFEITGAP